MYQKKYITTLLLFLLAIVDLDSSSISKDFSVLQWDWTAEQMIGSDPNHHNRYIAIKLPQDCSFPPDHIIAARDHLMLTYEKLSPTFNFLSWLSSRPKAVWIYYRSINTWTQVNNIPHDTVLKWLYAFSADNTLIFDVFVESKAAQKRYIRRYWVRIDKISCHWQDLYEGDIIDAVACTNRQDKSYRYLYILEPARVHKLDLLRLTTLSVNVAEESTHLILQPQENGPEDAGWLIVSSDKANLKLKASTLTP